MKIANTSARIIHFNLGGALVTLPPLGTIELADKQADAAKLVLAGPYRSLVEDGSLVVDGSGQPSATPASASGPSTSSVATPPGTPSHAPPSTPSHTPPSDPSTKSDRDDPKRGRG